jgi:hypothetical protein
VRKVESQALASAISKLWLSVSIARERDRFGRPIQKPAQKFPQNAAAKDEAIAIRFEMKRRCAGKLFSIQNFAELVCGKL